jgi:hypothetical protein
MEDVDLGDLSCPAEGCSPVTITARMAQYLPLDTPTVGSGPLLQLRNRYLPEQFRGAFPPAPPGTATVSFTPQGSLPWLPRNVSTDYLIICAPSGTSIPSGAIYQIASAHNIAPLSPSSAKSLLYRRKANNAWTILLATGTAVSLAIPAAGQAGLIAMNTKWVTGLLAGHAVFDYASGQISSRIPDPGPTIDILLDPNAILSFSGSCVEATMAVRSQKIPVSGTYTVP